ncbi:LamG domain-containing protein [Candidatus Poribacteria bacterium]|nr:LamG domain-containing protein [Candidatus Poribacteria bacterium]
MKFFGLLSVIILIGMATTMSFAAIDPSTIVGLWHFDEGNGSTVADSSGNGHDGEIDGAVWVDGKMGDGLEFDGDDSVIVPDAPDLRIGEQLTMMAWFFATDIGDWRQIIAKSDEYLLRIDPPQEGNRMSSFVKAGGGWEPRASAMVPDLDTWTHYAAVYDSSLADNQLKVYVNGVESGASTRPGIVDQTENPVEFGKWGGGSFFVGTIDEVAIFNVALSEADIQTVMDVGFTAVQAKDKLATTWGNVKQTR